MSYLNLARFFMTFDIALPDELQRAAAARDVLRAELVKLRSQRPRDFDRPAISAKVFQETLSTGSVPDVTRLVFEGQAGAATHSVAVIALEYAAEQAEEHLERIVQGESDALIESIRPGFFECLAEVKRLPKDTPTDEITALKASAKVQADYKKLELWADRYTLVMRCLDELHRTTDFDKQSYFVDSNRWPEGNFISPDSFTKHGPPATSPRERVKYLANDPAAKPWLPTLSEREREWHQFRLAVNAGAVR